MRRARRGRRAIDGETTRRLRLIKMILAKELLISEKAGRGEAHDLCGGTVTSAQIHDLASESHARAGIGGLGRIRAPARAATIRVLLLEPGGGTCGADRRQHHGVVGVG